MSKKDSIADVMIKPPEVEKRTGKPRTHDRGFTLIEIVVVLIVLGVMTTVIASRFITKGANDLMVETDGLKASLRYAQIQALNDTVTWGIHLSGDGISYVLYKGGSPAVDGSGNPVMIPVKISDASKDPPPNNTHKLQGGVQITAGAGTTATYDKWGRPVDASGSPVTTTLTITLSCPGENPNRIAITPETGFLYVP